MRGIAAFVPLGGCTSASPPVQSNDGLISLHAYSWVPAIERSLPAGDAYLGLTTHTETRLSAGDWDISFRSASSAVWPDDSALDGTATLQ